MVLRGSWMFASRYGGSSGFSRRYAVYEGKYVWDFFK